MPQTQYNLHLKGFVGGADFDRNYVDYILVLSLPQNTASGRFSPPTTYRRNVTSLSLTTSLRQGKRSFRCRIYSFRLARTARFLPALTTNYDAILICHKVS